MLTKATDTDQCAPVYGAAIAPEMDNPDTKNPIHAPRLAAFISAFAAATFD